VIKVVSPDGEEIEAIQHEEFITIGDRCRMREWFKQGEVTLVVDGDCLLLSRESYRSLTVAHGDWIMKAPDGVVGVSRNHEFRRKYKPLPSGVTPNEA